MAQVFANAARSTLVEGIDTESGYIKIAAADSKLFPHLYTGDWFYLTLQDDAGNIEIVKVLGKNYAGDTFTVDREWQGTTARAFPAGTVVGLRLTAWDARGWTAAADAGSSGDGEDQPGDLPSPGTLPSEVIHFWSDDTWEAPADGYVRVCACGGGGGSGWTDTKYSLAGGGGGAGALAFWRWKPIKKGDELEIEIGKGGAASDYTFVPGVKPPASYIEGDFEGTVEGKLTDASGNTTDINFPFKGNLYGDTDPVWDKSSDSISAELDGFINGFYSTDNWTTQIYTHGDFKGSINGKFTPWAGYDEAPPGKGDGKYYGEHGGETTVSAPWGEMYAGGGEGGECGGHNGQPIEEEAQIAYAKNGHGGWGGEGGGGEDYRYSGGHGGSVKKGFKANSCAGGGSVNPLGFDFDYDAAEDESFDYGFNPDLLPCTPKTVHKDFEIIGVTPANQGLVYGTVYPTPVQPQGWLAVICGRSYPSPDSDSSGVIHGGVGNGAFGPYRAGRGGGGGGSGSVNGGPVDPHGSAGGDGFVIIEFVQVINQGT